MANISQKRKLCDIFSICPEIYIFGVSSPNRPVLPVPICDISVNLGCIILCDQWKCYCVGEFCLDLYPTC